MKVGDKIRYKRQEGIATVVSMRVERTWDDLKKKTVTKTRYTARYDDTGYLLNFYGYNIGKTVFKCEPVEQLSFLDEI
jgi:hypothetical protein